MGTAKAKNTGLYIIVADDDWEDHELIKKAIKECNVNHTVSSVFNGMQLMHLLLKKGFYKNETTLLPDLILLDLRMELMNGLQVLKEIKDNPDLNSVTVYVLTDTNDPEITKQAMALGAKGYYNKPLSYDELTTLVDKICTGLK